MSDKAVIIGAGVGGLSTALLLARGGIDVTIVEQDAMPVVADGDDAFARWERRSVPQWRQGHVFQSRLRSILLQRAPDVLQRLDADGIGRFNLLDGLPAESRRDDDEQFTMVATRRPAFDLALRRAVADEPKASLRSPAKVVGLLVDDTTPLRIIGVRLADGIELSADFVVDCGGRRSPVATWLASHGVLVPTRTESCQITYYGRYFRRAPTFDIDPAALTIRRDLGYLFYLVCPGDHGTYSISFAVPPWDRDLSVLRHESAWNVLADNMPLLAPLVDVNAATPIQPVTVMAGCDNLRRRYVLDGQPLAVGLLAVGDALSTTNPIFGWGATMALVHAVAAADAVLGHHGDPETATLAYDTAVDAETDAVFCASSASDRVRAARYRGDPVHPQDTRTAEEEDLIERGVIPGARRDPELLRALLRRSSLLDPPDALFTDPITLVKARAEQDRIAAKPTPRFGPTRAELLALLAAARPPQSTRTRPVTTAGRSTTPPAAPATNLRRSQR
jgi:2-polyprenyl-6-methoxyphenol hydroxylase-like FAD-dependent oxidoreductase